MGVVVTLADISNAQQITSAATALNSNATIITDAFEGVLSTSNTSIPNSMNTNLDMNSNQIINLPAPASLNSPARLVDVTGTPTISVPPVGTSGATVPLLNANNTWSGIQTYGVGDFVSNSATQSFPASGLIVGTTDTQTLTNKTLTAPVIGTITNTGTLTLPTSTDTLVGRATTDTLTNKTLTSPTITSPTVTGSGSIGGSTSINTTGTAATGALTVTGAASVSGLLNTGGFSRVSSNQTYTSNAVLANVPGLSATLAASTNYTFEIYLISPAASYENIQVALSGTCTASSIVCYASCALSSSISTSALILGLNSALTLASSTNTQGVMLTVLRGTILVNAGGTFTAQVAQEASSANSLIIEAGSYMRVFQVT
jgi:hypothetical protein